ncbi:MAG: hypothetical protein EZS28_015604 [Streblomastix strix]|uniref:Uncharacterized protein n=1 Tax=Streblomastix strix TaxID=222440 RepID=A0A5J4W2W6_9EUKA|nr:MAG: hypothetical protein EZS28_015604 [Streblomastix strix]
MGTQFHNAFSYKWSKVKQYIHPPIPVLNRLLQKMKQDKAKRIIIAPIWPGQSWYTKLKNLSIKFLFLGQADRILQMGERMKDKDQKTSTRQCGRLPSEPVADVGRDLLMRCMKMRGFYEEGINLLFNRQRFNTVKRDFYSLVLLEH